MENEDDLEPIFGGPDVVHNRWLNKDQYFVMLYGMFTNEHGIEIYMHDCIPYAQYVLYKEKKIIVKPWEFIYHLNRDWKDDRIENLKVIDLVPKDIEVKYPYDPEKYYGRLRWDKTYKRHIVILFLKKEYRNNKTLKKEINRSINIYIAETEILKRFLNNNEKVIFINGDKTIYNKENLKVIEKGERGNSKYPIGEVPFQEFYIGYEYKRSSGYIHIKLIHIDDITKDTTIIRSKYRYELKIGRRLEHNEYLVYKDGNKLNDDIDNLTHKTLELAEHPFENYFIGNIFIENKNERKRIWLRHETNPEENLTMNYSRYRMQIIEGRIFETWEEVDHIDGNKFNDSDNNLQILTDKEHRKKSDQDRVEMAPKVTICCDGCNEKFELQICILRGKLIWINKQELNNIFCCSECRRNYIQNGNDIQKKELIKYICAGTGVELFIPENAKFLPSRFNPDALPFYDRFAVLKWLFNKYR